MQLNHRKGHRERLREKYLKAGVKAFHNYEILELLLTYAIPQKDVKPIAKELFKRFHCFSEIIDAKVNDLISVPGIGKKSAVLIKVAREICCCYLEDNMKKKDVLSTPIAVLDFARMKLTEKEDEAVMIIYLNVKNHVNSYEIINEGTIDQAAAFPRTIIKKSLANNSSAIIMVHNHPSGICDPSDKDKKLTEQIQNGLAAVNMKLLDHIIVGKSGYFSFMENGLLETNG